MTRSSWIVPALSCAVLAAGCAGAPISAAAPTAAAAPTPPADGAAGWMDQYCGALLGVPGAHRTIFDLDSTPSPTSPEQMLAGLNRYLDGYAAAMNETIAHLKTVGPAPSPAGDTAVADLTTSLTAFQTDLAKIKKELVLEPLSRFQDTSKPLQAVVKDPRLSAAAKNAPNCQKIPGWT